MIFTVTPKAVPLAGGLPLRIEGDNFDQATIVTIDGLPCNVTRMVTKVTKRELT